MFHTYHNVKVYYECTGEGKNLLLLHGWGCNTKVMAGFASEFSGTRKVWSIDFPGFGESDYPNGVWTVDDYMEMTADFIRKMGIEGTDVICHSFGGRVMIKLAAKYPELAGKIAFVDAAGVKKKRSLAFHLRTMLYKLCKKALKIAFLKKLLKVFGIDAEARVKNAGSADYKALPDCMKGTFVKVVNEDLTPYLSRIKSPSLLIYGENDEDTPVSLAKIMEKKIPDAGLAVIAGTGHFSFLDAPGQVMRILRVFLEG